ncbi:apolipoprotein C-I [Notolabrus celidotus]|uniref:apolipoprotein C-I n=1 Tax=Notolabrus celidotus TaxID=1203425 RepID=UPI00148F7597|nr:apolipoprotein C-I [Notolabrus celidotus]
MRLYLAVAVLMLALVAYTEAQDDTVEQKFAKFGEQMTELGQNLADKTQTAFQGIHESEFATTTRDWFAKQMEKLKAKLGEITQ